MEKNIILSGETFKYELTRKKVKNTNIKIDIDGNIKVSIPKYLTIKELEAILKKEEPFIRRSIQEQSEKKKKMISAAEYENGQHLLIYGQLVLISVYPSQKDHVVLCGDRLSVFLSDTDNDELRKETVNSFLDEKAKEMILNTVDEIYPLFSYVLKEKPKIRLKRMKSQWGSCTPSKNALSFNLGLVHYPLQCTRYVVIHEFCHFIYFNHSKQFYKEIEKIMPDYLIWKKILSTRTELL